ncbi:hypothetical protein Tco_1537979 [Tanacetum coccineum]
MVTTDKYVLTDINEETINALLPPPTTAILEQLMSRFKEEMDLKWQVAMISMRLKKSKGNTRYKSKDNGRRPGKQEEPKALVTLDGEGVDWTDHAEDEQENFALMAYSNSGSDTEVTSCSKECVESYAKLKKLYDEQREQLGDASIEIQAYTQALKKVEAQLVTHQKNQLWYEEKIRFMKIDLDDKTDVLTYHKKLLAEAVKEKEELKTKLENFQSSSKGLSKLLNSQMSKRDKSGLGYGDQVHDGVLSYENEVFQSVFDSRSSDVEDSPVHDRFANVEGMHAVPPPMTGNYMPSGPDREVDDSMFTYGSKQSKTSESDTQTSNFDSCESNSSVETLESVPEPVVVEPKVVSQPKVWSDAPIIEEYESDSDDEYVIQPSKEQEKPSSAFVKHVKTPRETVKEQNTYSPSPKADKRDWNGLMSKRLGLGYGFTKKACFVCGSFSHLIRDCDFHEKRLAKHVELNKKKGTGTSQKENKPVWNNVQRLNHQNQFVPTAVLTRTGRIPVNTASHNFNSQAVSTSAARKVNAVRPIVKAVSAVGGKGKLLLIPQLVVIGDLKDITRTNSPNTMVDQILENDYPQRALQNKGIVNSGCSKHMTRNKAYLAEYQDYNGGPVAFKGNEGDQVQTPHDSPLSGGHTSDRAEGALNLHELSVFCTNLSNRVLALESIKDAQAAEISALKSRIKKLEKKCKPSISHHRAWLKSVNRLSMNKRFGKKESVSKQGRKKSKPESTLDDSTVFDDQDADHGMEYMETKEAVDEGRQSGETEEVKLTDDTKVVKDKGSGDKGGNDEELVSTARPKSTARPDIDAARQEDYVVEPRTPPTTTSIFNDEDITMAQTLIKMKEEKAKEKGVSIKDVDDSSRPARSILTLKPLPTIDPKDKGKGVLKESPVKKVKRSDLDAAQIAKDAEIARLVHEKELAEMEREREERQRQDQASVDYIASLYDEVQAKMDASEELAARLQNGRDRDIQALYIKEQERDADFVPIRSERDEKMNKKVVGMDDEEVPEEPESTKVEVKQEGREENIRKRSGRRLKMKATKKSKRQKTDSDLEEEEQLRASLKIVPDEEEEIDYEVLGTRYPIVNWESAFYHTDRYGVPHDYYRVFRANGSSRYIKTFTEMVSRFDRLDFIELHSLVMQRFSTTTPEGIDLVLWGDLRIMFEETADDDIWKNQEKWIIKSWTFYENCGVHILALEDGTEIHMLAERRYPLIRETLERMMELRLTAESEGEAVFDLLRFIQKQIDEFGGQDGSEKDL